MITVTTNPATDIGVTFGKIWGHFISDEQIAWVYFQYKEGADGEIQNYNKFVNYVYEGDFSLSLGNRKPNQIYYFRAGASTFLGPASWGSWLSFTTNSPIIRTDPATNIDFDAATLNGFVEDFGEHSSGYWIGFQWKEGLSGEVQDWYDNYGPFHGYDRAFSHNIDYLNASTVYYFRFWTSPFIGDRWYGGWHSFVTQFDADVNTKPATNIQNLSAQINGEVITGQDEIVERGFHWKRGEAGNEQKEIVGSGGGSYSKQLTSLVHGTLYFFRAYGKGDSGAYYWGDWLYFTTTSIIPTVSTQIATDIEPLSVTGNGTIIGIGGEEPYCDKRGFEVTYSFSGTLEEYKAWEGHGFTGDITLNSGTGLWEGTLVKLYEESGVFSTIAFALSLDDLICDKEFLYRARAKNTAGWGCGSYKAFITSDLLKRKSCTCGIFTVMLCAYIKPIPSGSVIKRRGFRWGKLEAAEEYDIHEDGNFSASAAIGPVDTISFVNSADDSVYDTIVDSSEGFLTAGFEEGKFIDVSATGATNPANKGQFKIISVTASTITVNVRNTLVSEAVTGVTIVELYALYIVDLEPETDYYSVAYVAIEDSGGNWTAQEGNVTETITITNIFDFEGYDKVEFYKPEREQNYRKITRKIEAEIIAEQQYIDKAGGRRVLDIPNHLIQTKANAIFIGTNYKDTFKNIKSRMEIEYPTPAPFQREDTLDIGFGRIRFKEDGKGVVNFMPDGEGLMLFRYRMVMIIRKINMGYTVSKDDVDYIATMELEGA
ncbi:hypothetical protein ES703_08468 [subsurface metagenome]